jgi:hypothetical protein
MLLLRHDCQDPDGAFDIPGAGIESIKQIIHQAGVIYHKDVLAKHQNDWFDQCGFFVLPRGITGAQPSVNGCNLPGGAHPGFCLHSSFMA